MEEPQNGDRGREGKWEIGGWGRDEKEVPRSDQLFRFIQKSLHSSDVRNWFKYVMWIYTTLWWGFHPYIWLHVFLLRPFRNSYTLLLCWRDQVWKRVEKVFCPCWWTSSPVVSEATCIANSFRPERKLYT